MEGQGGVKKDTQFEDAARAVAEIFKFLAGMGGGQAPGVGGIHALGSNTMKAPFNAPPQANVRVPSGFPSQAFF